MSVPRPTVWISISFAAAEVVRLVSYGDTPSVRSTTTRSRPFPPLFDSIEIASRTATEMSVPSSATRVCSSFALTASTPVFVSRFVRPSSNSTSESNPTTPARSCDRIASTNASAASTRRFDGSFHDIDPETSIRSATSMPAALPTQRSGVLAKMLFHSSGVRSFSTA